MSKWKKILLPDFEWKPFDNEIIDTGSDDQLLSVRVYKFEKLFHGEGIKINKLPVVVSTDGDVWIEAAIYIFYKIVEDGMKSDTISSISDGLAVFKNYIDEIKLDWLDFSGIKMKRPTYRFYGFLKIRVQSGEISPSTASRLMKSIIGFYRWLIGENLLNPRNLPWAEKEVVHFGISNIGVNYRINVIKTDLSLMSGTVNYEYGESIIDGSRLRPIPSDEQAYIFDFLKNNKNIEMKLIFIFALVTGARLQTILTMTSEIILNVCEEPILPEVRIPVGAGTKIDTKRNKQLVIIIPGWFVMKLQMYINSERALKRKRLASEKYCGFLFLSRSGQPMYEKRMQDLSFGDGTRYFNNGQAVRQYLANQMLPWIRKKYGVNFKFKFHDLRATFGMNLTEFQIGLVEQGLITLSEARNYVQFRMGHSSAQLTDHYLNYKRKISQESFIRDEFYLRLKSLIDEED